MKRFASIILVLSLLFSMFCSYAEEFSTDENAIDAAAKSVVKLEVYNKRGVMVATGSGFVAFDNRTLITNYHVIDDAYKIMANSDDNFQYELSAVLCANKKLDIAILQFASPTDLKPLPLHAAEDLKRGAKVVAIGSPIGIKNTVSMGNISNVYIKDNIPWIQITAPISHGSSGGALFNDAGQVIGVTSAGYSTAQNVNLAINISVAKAMYNAWDGRTRTIANSPINSRLDYSGVYDEEESAAVATSNPMTTAAIPSEWVCFDCEKTNSMNFCLYCGSSKPVWVCLCGKTNITKFCGECGNALERLLQNADKAYTALQDGRYEEAIAIFTALESFDSQAFKTSSGETVVAAEQIKRAYYDWAVAEVNNASDTNSAIGLLTQAEGYQDALSLQASLYYKQGVAMQLSGQYEAAIDAFKSANDFADAPERILETYYLLGEKLLNTKDYEGASAAFEKAGSYSDAANRILEPYYIQGKTLLAMGEEAEAIAAFKKAGAFSDAENQYQAIYYTQAQKCMASKDYDGAIAAFKQAGSYRDAADLIKEANYLKAISLMDRKDYKGAYVVFMQINGYKDVDNILASDERMKAEMYAQYTVGSCITFGHYPQTASGNDSTPIEWIIIAREGKKALLLSRYALDCQPFNNVKRNVTWETSSIRTWLNETFLNTAFNSKEKADILTTTVNADKNSYYNISPGKTTQDSVFLLSGLELDKYLDKEVACRCMPTEYAVKKGAATTAGGSLKGNGKWWLRSPGHSQNMAMFVAASGSSSSYGSYVNEDTLAVRPAIWVNAYVEAKETTPAATPRRTPKPTPKITKYIIITNSSANIRSGPDSNSKILKCALKGETFVLLGQENGWYKINVNGKTGYVSMKLSTIK